MPTLYEISGELHGLQVALDEMELSTEEQSAAIDVYLDGAGDLKDKLNGYCSLIREYEATADARKAEGARLAALAAADTKRAKSLRERLAGFFGAHKLPKVQTGRFDVSLAANGGVMPLTAPDVEACPAEFLDVTVTMPHAEFVRVYSILANTGEQVMAATYRLLAVNSISTSRLRAALEAVTATTDETGSYHRSDGVPGAQLGPRGKRISIK